MVLKHIVGKMNNSLSLSKLGEMYLRKSRRKMRFLKNLLTVILTLEQNIKNGGMLNI